ncbi:DNA protecting protein DprA [Thalassovita gelatinovora]|uniref:DNA protecting protein DprA n=1 Tax=Thalassovita gelatinovora TaxID=53501 RepID=A0A0P1F801_THAGE|nr:DNA-processing protein DprA [Thalassovita gelatinovora]QIZ80301.1 DNA-protecting protein DprA [Thalassovita gelatinovora]CUH64204.1 DNA protecting protein DprA [Thalassovita gelatinovora]SEQ85412.1 DNA protecting protein DprA [Thalassovita gelatinovora]
MTDPKMTAPSPEPIRPPQTDEDRLSWIRLLRSPRVGVSTFYRLMGEHVSARAALQALPEVARAAGVDTYTPCPDSVAQAELQAARHCGASMICIGSPDYPAALAEIPDAPPFFWVIGRQDVLLQPMIALVGARNASSLGTRMARGLAKDLAAQGYIIVSGMARGVDAAAHHASLQTGTVAVMAGGADVLYPSENTTLGQDIAKTGARISERAFGLNPRPRDFPRRNRIISGLAQAVVIVEAAAKSGSLITARNALDQGRDVLAVPGHPFDARTGGCNMLIRDGARLIRNAEDVIEALPPRSAPAKQAPADQVDLPLAEPDRRKPDLKKVADLHRQILNRLSPSPLAEDQLIRDLHAPPQTIMPVLTDLELEGRIKRHPGGLLALS